MGGQPQAGTGTGGASAGGAGGSGGSAGNGAGGGAGSTHTGVWNIMPLGDSITGTTCYPQLLSAKLKAAGHTSFEFIGSNTNNQSCTDGSISNAPNVTTEGHACYVLGCLTGDVTGTTCAASSGCDAGRGTTAELATWMAATPHPDVVLVHFGTNDVWNGIAPANVTASYTKLLASVRGANPSVIVLMAQILPMHPNGCTDGSSGCPNDDGTKGVKQLNAAIPAWATGASTAASPVFVVNIYGSVGDETAYVPNSTLTTDGVHPNPKGSGLVADAWMTALVAQGIP
jgi:lysophospholipase L1-like esterase